MSGRTKKQEKAMRRASRASQIRVIGFDEVGPSKEEKVHAWSENIKRRYIEIGGQERWDARAEVIRDRIVSMSEKNTCHPLEAALIYHERMLESPAFSEDEKLVVGPMILAIGYLEFGKP